jgi:hypothetical protein
LSQQGLEHLVIPDLLVVDGEVVSEEVSALPHVEVHHGLVAFVHPRRGRSLSSTRGTAGEEDGKSYRPTSVGVVKIELRSLLSLLALYELLHSFLFAKYASRLSLRSSGPPRAAALTDAFRLSSNIWSMMSTQQRKKIKKLHLTPGNLFDDYILSSVSLKMDEVKGELRLRASVVENVNAGLHNVLRVCALERVDYDGKRSRH